MPGARRGGLVIRSGAVGVLDLGKELVLGHGRSRDGRRGPSLSWREQLQDVVVKGVYCDSRWETVLGGGGPSNFHLQTAEIP